MATRTFSGASNLINRILRQKKIESYSKLNRSTVHYIPQVSLKSEQWSETFLEANELLDYDNNLFGVENILDRDVKVKQHVLKMLATKHPLVQNAKQLFYDTRINVHVYGIISMLVAKAAGHTLTSPDYEEALQHKGITKRQRKLADALELYRSYFNIHSSVLNLPPDMDATVSNKALQKVNGLGVLGGDYLAANASVVLASIRDSQVLGLVAKGCSDYSEAAFHSDSDKNGNLLPNPVKTLEHWEHCTFLEHASILSHGCQGMLVLAGHSQQMQTAAADFGKYLAMAMKVDTDISVFEDLTNYHQGTPFSVALAPVCVHLGSDQNLLETIVKDGKDDITNLDFQKIYLAVKGSDSLKKTADLLNVYVAQAEENLLVFGDTKSTDILRRILKSLAEPV